MRARSSNAFQSVFLLLVVSLLTLNGCSSPSSKPAPLVATISGPSQAIIGQLSEYRVAVQGVPEDQLHNYSFQLVQTSGPQVKLYQNNNVFAFVGQDDMDNQHITLSATVSRGGNTSAPVQKNVRIYNHIKATQDGERASFASWALINVLSRGATLASELVIETHQPEYQATVNCRYGGQRITSMLTPERSFPATAGDKLQVEFQQCVEVNTGIEGEVNGRIEIDIEQLETGDTELVKAKVTATEFENGSHSRAFVDGTFSWEFERQFEGLSVTTSVQQLNMTQDKTELFQASDFTVEQSQNYRSAKFQINARGTIKDMRSGDELKYTQEVPWGGRMGMYPHTGRASLESQNLYPLVLKANAESNTNDMTLEHAGHESSLYWGHLASPSLWMLARKGYYQVVSYRANALFRVGAHPTVNFEDLSPADPIVILYSSPLASASARSNEFIPVASGEPPVPFTTRINGGMLELVPETPLTPGLEYQVNRLEAVAADIDASNTVTRHFIVRDTVVARPLASSLVYKAGDKITLNASRSSAKRGRQMNFEWSHVKGPKVAIAQPNSATTEVEFGEDASESVFVRLAASNEFKDQAFAEVEFFPQPVTPSYLAFRSEPNEPIIRNHNGIRTNHTSHFDPGLGGENRNGASIRVFAGSESFRVSIGAPTGEELQVKHYPNANNSGAVVKEQPFLEFSGLGNSCSKTTGDFEVKEIAFGEGNQLERLSVHFTQYCTSYPDSALQGQLYFNTNQGN
ncbi:Ig-like domain-containing protein [Paraferrimonas sedimenticola]|uniref:Uncharacterized protein n=1 Tax=Paraferrimonas sedimenticola TaxID=375674 RepID=A0AA37RXR5_9GAMM|nr:Ig-like domain-containing protein [Paraferrimonas sedimenticola]GLP97013.1 hypothetical protein GCM10007895_23190 [Paraferrimonas sedimenticola]